MIIFLSRASTIRALWAKTTNCLIIIEAGNEEGFRAILETRQTLIAECASKDPAKVEFP